MLSIDVTDKQLKLVRGSLAGNRIKINDVETREVPEECIVNGYITDIPPVADIINKMLAEKRITDKEVIVCINSSSILYKELELTKPKNLKNTTAIEAMIIAQMGISTDYNISYSIVGESQSESGEAMMKVMATACPQRMVDSYQSLFGQTGLKLKQINISNNCITRLILNTPKLREAMPFMCIQVDNDFVNINLYEEGQVALSRYIKIDPADYDDNPDYVNIAVFDNLFRMIQFIGQRPGAKPLKQILFYGVIKDFVALSNSIMSFNIPAHVLATPTNIVRQCDVDFSKYANAIGAFYRVDPNLEHINLLDSMAVVAKQAGNTLPLKVLSVVGIAVAAVFVVNFIIDQIDVGVNRDIANLNASIEAGKFDEKEEEMNKLNAIKNNFDDYKYMVKLARVMFDYLPRGDLPQIKEKLLDTVKEVEDAAEQKGQFFAFHDFSWNIYRVSFTVYCESTPFPDDFADALINGDFFEGVKYSGYKTIERAAVPEEVKSEIPNSMSEVMTFDISLRLKGGHIFEDDGKKYGEE